MITDHTAGRGDGPDPTHPDPTSAGSPTDPTILEPDPSVRDIARAARAAFLGRDLLHPRPRLWPFGAGARARRERTRQIAEVAQRRRAQFRQALAAAAATGQTRPPRRWRPVGRRANVAAITALVVVVGGVFALALYFGGRHPAPAPAPEPAPAAGPPPAVSATVSAAVESTAATSPTPHSAAVPPQPPIPSGGVPAATARPRPPVDPATVAVVDPPTGPPSDADLATADGAMRAWLARWCPFTYTDPLGAAEDRARPAMTGSAWAAVDPRGNDGARQSWQKTVTAQESGRCAAPTAIISPEAPRSDTAAIVIGSITRVVTGPGRAPYAEPITQVRVVERGADGRWRVHLESTGG